MPKILVVDDAEFFRIRVIKMLVDQGSIQNTIEKVIKY
jgi:hypothetical protein